ncbi:MAG: ABC transporter permease, partial [Betaproteobacteria bacterium]|nr:ABC transporter permease [Betaproteobacteria bacterium]
MVVSLAWRDLRASGRSLWVFCACLALGVALIAASGGLFRLVSTGLVSDTRTLFGGDLEIEHRVPLSADELAWMRERGEVSRLVELRTMMRAGDRAHLVELRSYDERYPLYGKIVLQPEASLAEALTRRNGQWGAAIDPALARRLGLAVGDEVRLGDLALSVRALIARQPDRSLRADWRGPPVLIAGQALEATGLVQPLSRVAYKYRVKTSDDPSAWRAAFAAAFPGADWEARTFAERSERLSEVLGQIVSGLLLIGFSALFIGGLGVFNSVHAYLQGKLATIATLRAVGLRDRRLAAVYLAQILILAAASSLAGAVLGGALALMGASVAAQSLPVAPTLSLLPLPLLLAWVFGVLTAVTFALPALGRALSVSPAALFRGIDGAVTRTPALYWKLTAASGALTTGLALAVMPDPRFGLAFVAVTLLLLALLEGMVRLLRTAAHRLAGHPRIADRFAMRLALANLYQPGSPLRASLLSLGSALTLLVASTLVVAALLRTVNETIPEQAPALVFYDIPAPQLVAFQDLVAQSPSLERLDVAPLVLGRVSAVNNDALRSSGDAARALEARDEHKLSYRLNNFDNVVIDRGAWWPEDYRGAPLVAMEDREADELGLKVGDRLRFDIMGTAVDAELTAIYSQRRFQARFWLEAIFSDGALDPHITRYVGAAYMDHGESAA